MQDWNGQCEGHSPSPSRSLLHGGTHDLKGSVMTGQDVCGVCVCVCTCEWIRPLAVSNSAEVQVGFQGAHTTVGQALSVFLLEYGEKISFVLQENYSYMFVILPSVDKGQCLPSTTQMLLRH